MNLRIFPVLLAVPTIILKACPGHAEAADTQKVLDQITSTADKICNVVSTRGEANSSEVKGSVNAQLSGLAAKLANLGVSGTGSITSEQYQNVLRSDLATTLKDNAACKLRVFDALQSKLLGPGPALAPGIDGVWHDTNDPNTVTHIVQRGDRFEFTRTGTLQSGIRYESSGWGRIRGDAYTSDYSATYQNGIRSTGSCSGALPREGYLTSRCRDTVLGEFYASAIRE
jgi:hypothetical protein